MADVVIALLTLVAALAAGAYLGHVVRACPYQKALTRIIAAANDPHNRNLGAALDEADELLHGPR